MDSQYTSNKNYSHKEILDLINKMSDDALFNLRWDAQRSALLGSMASLYREEAFVDTTIVADNKIYKAHKLLLSASSSYLKLILESVPPTQHAVLFMPHISSSDLGNVLNFIYDGEIKINRRSLKSFLSVAKLLRIKGMDELGDDLDINILNNPGGNFGGFNSTTLTSISSPHGYKRPPPSDSIPLSDDLPNGFPSSSKSSMTNSPSTMRSTSPRDKDDAQLYTSTNGGAQSNGNNPSEDTNTNEENKSKLSRPPALISSNGRSTESISSQASNNESSPCEVRNGRNSTSVNQDGDASPAKMRRPNSRPELEAPCEALEDESNGSREDLIIDSRKALDLHIGRYNSLRENGSLALEIDHDQGSPQDERSENNHSGMPHADQDMDDTYDDDDDDDEHFSLSIQPEVSLRESDESYSLHDRRLQHFKEASLVNSYGGGLPFLGSSSMSITPTAANTPGWSISSAASQLSLQQQMTLKHLSKLARPMQIPKAHQSGQSSPLSGGASFGGINEGILMRMMREPLQSGSSNSIKPLGSSSSSQGGFFDSPHGDPNSHLAGLRKQKRYVQCTSCSKVLSSLSALKRHMEDVHCARIQGKCLLCGRVYSSRNSLLTHVYSAHKKHHDYKAVARIIRESDFEQFATAMKTEIKQV